MSATAEIRSIVLLGGKSLSPNIVYQGKINSSQPNYNEKVYFGVAEKSFKHRFYNHTKSFTHEDYANDTKLSKKYWDIKRNNFIPKVSWSIVRECPPYSLSKRKCYLCLNEKLEINSYKVNNLLNKRSELINKCRHLNKHMLLRHDTRTSSNVFSCKSCRNVPTNRCLPLSI